MIISRIGFFAVHARLDNVFVEGGDGAFVHRTSHQRRADDALFEFGQFRVHLAEVTVNLAVFSSHRIAGIPPPLGSDPRRGSSSQGKGLEVLVGHVEDVYSLFSLLP